MRANAITQDNGSLPKFGRTPCRRTTVLLPNCSGRTPCRRTTVLLLNSGERHIAGQPLFHQIVAGERHIGRQPFCHQIRAHAVSENNRSCTKMDFAPESDIVERPFGYQIEFCT
ncbi:uncharacterized protein [Atheta coriaria]|uniref:uncharacterized protein n=1 Tax=Dalotia coriaria TaxID=877792 RepID=UPI0031F441D1